MNHRISLLVVLAVVYATSGCNESKASSAPVASSTAAVLAAAPTAARASAKTERVVFVDKEHACKCTQKRVDDSWAALQTALGNKASAMVERLHADTQENQVAPYAAMKAMVALPALYFLDAKGGFVDLLQGEVTKEQIQAVLGSAK
ncbi:MAG: hypothetical protein QM784_21545 [Polyangiaceae bacterium]